MYGIQSSVSNRTTQGSKVADEQSGLANEEPRRVRGGLEAKKLKSAGVSKGDLTKAQKAEILTVTKSEEFQEVAKPVYDAAVDSKSETQGIYAYRTTNADGTVSYRFDVVSGAPCGNGSTTCMITPDPIDGLDLVFKWHPHPYGGPPSASDYINSARLGAPGVVWRSRDFNKTRYRQTSFIGVRQSQ